MGADGGMEVVLSVRCKFIDIYNVSGGIARLRPQP
jgi:hypothetical protein